MKTGNGVDRKFSKTQPFSLWEQRAVVRYLHAQDIDPSEIHKCLMGACAESCPTYKEVKSWIDDLEQTVEDGDTVACAAAGSKEGPATETPTDPALVARIELLLLHDRRISIERVAQMACVSNHSAAAVLTNVLGMKKVCERWVPRLWTPEQREYRISVCEQLQQLYRDEGRDLIDRIIVGTEAFAMYYSPVLDDGPICLRKNSSPDRNHHHNPGDKYKPSIESKRVFALFFYDSQGFLAAELMDISQPPDAAEYIRILKEILAPAIKRKRLGADIKNYFIVQEPSPAHSSLDTQKALKELGLTPLPHPPASPDLEPHEYWLLKDLQRKVDGYTFRSMTDLWAKVQRCIYKHPDAEFCKSLKVLPERWSICIDKQGLYLL